MIFIEFQREWLDADAPLRRKLVIDSEAFEQAIAKASALIASARSARLPIVHAGLDLTSDPDYALFGATRGIANSGLRAAIPAAGTWTSHRSDFAPPFKPLAGEFVVKGRSGASVLKHSNLDAYLRNNDIRTIYLCGFATHVCVESTLREAHDLGLDAWIVADCCAAFTTTQHDHVLEHVVHHFGLCTRSAPLIASMEAQLCSS
ncbi:MAG: cysteine hydrolase [Erythrobacter sp.]|nr:cysteine hydrolase [Erythrobacter sp.]